MTATKDDEALDRGAREIKDAIDRCRLAMADLVPDAKAVVLNELHRWLVLEQATHDPAYAPERRH
jgi:hypothetical protein